MEDFINLMEAAGSISGIVGAWLIAFKCRYSRWAFFVYLCSNACWMVFALAEHRFWMLIQMIGFAASSFVGIWNYWISPYFSSAAAKIEA
jgi:hypothetical protein